MNRRTRYARRRGRSKPLLVLTDDPEPGEGITFAVKLVYRYRSELAPFALAGAETGAGFWLHAIHPAWWLGLAIATAVVSTLVVLVPGRWFANARSGPVLSRPIERVYTALVTMVTSGWLTAATWFGPETRPLPLVGFIAGVTVAVPWWMHRRRRDKVHVERTMAAWPDIADKIGLPDSKVRSVLVAPWGFLVRLALRKGHTYATAANAVPAIESGLGTRSGAVRVEPDEKRADHVTLRVVERDPHAVPIPWPETTRTGYAAESPLTDTITRPVELGVFEDGAPVRVPLLGRHVLVRSRPTWHPARDEPQDRWSPSLCRHPFRSYRCGCA